MRRDDDSSFSKQCLSDVLDNFSAADKESAPVYHRVKDAIEKAVKDVPSDMRLPSIRQIASTLHVALVTAHKAIQELIDEKILYSKPKSGVFTDDGRFREMGEHSKRKAEGFKGFIAFSTDSYYPWQKSFWNGLAASFTKCHSFVAARIDYEFAYSYNQPGVAIPDCMEFSEWELNSRTPDRPFMELDDFLTALGGGGITTIEKKYLPLYLTGTFIFFNREKMRSKRLPLPEYDNYDKQMDYLNELGCHAEDGNLIHDIATTIAPSDFSREFFDLFMKYIENEEFLAELSDYVDKLRVFYKGFYQNFWGLDVDSCQKLLHLFGTGKKPFFIGESKDAWQLISLYKDLDFEAAPLLTPENGCVTKLICGAVSSASIRPVESVRFLLYLLQNEQQVKLESVGLIPLNGQLRGILKTNLVGRDVYGNSFKSHCEDYIADPVKHYIKYCIFNNELLELCQGQLDPEEIIVRIGLLSKAFMKSRKQRKDTIL